MNVKIGQVADGVISFAETELLPAMGGWRLWAGSAALVLVRQRIDAIALELVNNKFVAMLQLVDENGCVDVDAAITALKETARKLGKLPVDLSPLGEFKLDEKDFDKLKDCITKAAE